MNTEEGEYLSEKEVPTPDMWQQLYEYAPCGYLSYVPGACIDRMNATLLSWLAYERKDVVGKVKFQDLLTPGGKIFYETQHAPLVKIQQQVNELSYQLIAKDGKRVPVLINTRSHQNENGKLCYHLAVMIYSDRKKYEKELLHAKRKAEAAVEAKMAFLSNVTHEIRTPMHAMMGATDFLLQENPKPQQTKWLNLLRVSALNLLDFINNVLDLSKIEAGLLHLEEKSFHLRKLIQDLVASFKFLADGKNVDMRVSLPSEMLDYYVGDSIKIRQILTNLVGNALKFTSEGYVELSVSLEDATDSTHCLHFKVQDTGIGMKEETLTKIFDPFAQADATIHSTYGGTGLGLSISQKILQAYASEMTVKSEIGVGTTFSFTLSLKVGEVDKPSSVLESESGTLPPLHGIRVLIVDDNASNLIIAARYFQQWSLDFDQASSGEEALRWVERKDYDLIFMDIKMPGLNGYETSQRIRSLGRDRYRQIPIIALSASASSTISQKMVDAGMNELILKPFQPVHLHSTIQMYTSKAGRDSNDSQPFYEEEIVDVLPVRYGSLRPDWSHLDDFFGQDSKQLHTYLRAALTDMLTIKQDFRQATSPADLTKFRAAVHKTKTLNQMLRLSDFDILIEQSRQDILADDVSAFISSMEKIDNHLDQIISWIQSDLSSPLA